MNHVSDQDLLLMSHRSLPMWREMGVRWHLRGCAPCRLRSAELGAVSTAIASAVRPGLPLWKPAGMALRLKLMIGMLVLSAGVFAGRAVVSYATTPRPSIADSCATVTTSKVQECQSDPKKSGVTGVGIPLKAQAKPPSK